MLHQFPNLGVDGLDPETFDGADKLTILDL